MIPTLTLNDGTTVPQVGFGTMLIAADRSPSPENMRLTAEVVGQAIQVGFRLFDTAQSYGNEEGVGEALSAADLPRHDFYVTTKLANVHHRPDDVRRSFDESLHRLRLDRLDLFLIHWPLPTLYDGDFVATWRAVAELMADGRLRSAGVSNFQPDHLDRIIGETGVVPAVNQIEVHPHFANHAARAACARHGIAVEAWSPLGHGTVLDDPVIGQVASDHGRSTGQVVLRWHVQHGFVVIPKTARTERMHENITLFDFELTAEEMAVIDALDQGEDGRFGPHPDTFEGVV